MARYGTFKHQGIPLKLDDGCYGEQFFVDGTNGNDGNLGTVPGKAFKTIQYALDKQIENRTGLMDKISIFPGAYAETLVGDLVYCKMVGLGVMPGTVRVTPVDSYAYHGLMNHAMVANMEFWSPSTTNPEYPAFYATTSSGASSMNNSIIDTCKFMGGNIASVVGLQIGAKATAAVWESMMYSKVMNCGFFAGGAAASEFIYGISVMAYDATTNQSKKMARQSHFFNNIIYAETNGIRLNVDSAALQGTVIEANKIRSQLTYGPTYGILCNYAAGSGDQTCLVIDNRICAVTDGIKGFKTNLVQGNIVAVAAGAPAAETA